MPAGKEQLRAPDLDGTPELRRWWTELCTQFGLEHIDSLPDQPVWDVEGAEQLAATFVEPLPESPESLESLLPRLDRAAAKTFNTASPGYLAFIPTGGIYLAALADYLAATMNRYVGVWNPAPALVQIEQTAINWIKTMLGWPESGNGILTSGGSVSNLIATITARQVRLGDDFRNAMIYVTSEAHHCVAKSIRLAGFPASAIHIVKTDSRLRMDPAHLRQSIDEDRAAGRKPFMVVASAGTTNTGAIDPVPAIADVCQQNELWLHVDAAYGGFFRATERGGARLPGLERADSLVVDPHKGLFLPYGTGCLLMADSMALRRAHETSADYLQDLHLPTDHPNFADMSPELSRDFRGLRIWLPLKLLGADAFRHNLDEKLDLAEWAWQQLEQMPGFECLDPPQLSVVPFRYRPKTGSIDEFNQRLLQAVNRMGHVFLTSTRIRGEFVLRIAVLSFRTHMDRVQQCIEDLRVAAATLESGSDLASVRL